MNTLHWDRYSLGAFSIEHSDSGMERPVEWAAIAEMLLRHRYVGEKSWRQDALWVYCAIARLMADMEAEGRRRRRGRARRLGFAGGADFSTLPEDLKRY